jgi:hypothetical protein
MRSGNVRRTAAAGLLAAALIGTSLAASGAGAAAAPTATLEGTVTVAGSGEPVADVAVYATGLDLFATGTDDDGNYRFEGLEPGEYDLVVRTGHCLVDQEVRRNVSGTTRVNMALTQRADRAGYTCRDTAEGTFNRAGAVLPLEGDDATTAVTLPFDFPLYGTRHRTAHVSTNGLVSFAGASAARANSAIPSAAAPNAAIYPFWDDLTTRTGSSIRTATVGSSPNRRFVIEWRSMAFTSYQFANARVDFEVVLYQDGRVLMQYENINPDWNPTNQNARAEQGGVATIGIENHDGSTAFQYTHNTRTLRSGHTVLFRPPAG